MEVKTCRLCGRLYQNQSLPGYKGLCPSCASILEKKFVEAKEYLYEHRNATVEEVSNECNVSVKQIEKWVREGRLYYADAKGMVITCEKCGVSISTGKFCNKCKAEMENEMKASIKGAVSAPKDKRTDNPRFRTLG